MSKTEVSLIGPVLCINWESPAESALEESIADASPERASPPSPASLDKRLTQAGESELSTEPPEAVPPRPVDALAAGLFKGMGVAQV